MSPRKKHYFIGMKIELVKDGKINIGIQYNVNESIEPFGEDMPIGVESPATSRLFDVTEGVEKLLEEKAATFHSMVAKLLWIMKRSRPDIETAIYFLCTQVKDPDINDWGKLRQVLKLISKTIG